ncbi:UNVERIFIED_CONTAM: hypothetical protein Sindi_1939600 [Sesamum indicum]
MTWARTILQPLHPCGAILKLDVIDFRNIEKLIDEWVATIKLAATNLELNKGNFINLVELSLEGSVKIRWDNIPEDTKAVSLSGTLKSAIVNRLGRFIKIYFIGDGYFKGNARFIEITPTRRTFRPAYTKANESFKDCNTGPIEKKVISRQTASRNIVNCKFELMDDIQDVVYYGDLVPIYRFRNLPSDESVYEEEIGWIYNRVRITTTREIGFKPMKAIGVFSRMTLSNKTMERIMRQNSNLSLMMDLGLEEVVESQPNRTKSEKTSHNLQSEFAIPMELTGNVMESAAYF